MMRPDPPPHERRDDLGSSLTDQDVFIRRHGRTFTTVVTVISTVITLPLAVGLFLASGVVSDGGDRWGVRAAGAVMLGTPAFFWAVCTFIIRVRSRWRR